MKHRINQLYRHTFSNCPKYLNKTKNQSSLHKFINYKNSERLSIAKTLFIFSFLLSLYSCNKPEYYQIRGFAQGTTYNIIYQTNKNQNFETEISTLLQSFDKSLSSYDSSSIISHINRNEKIDADSLFIKCFNIGQKVSTQTNGAFDITVGPLVKAYGFSAKKGIEMTQTKIDSFLQFIGYEKIYLDKLKLKKADSRIILDVNAIAQGYSVDIVAAFLETNEIKNYLVEIGGELRAKGLNSSGKKWRIGIDKPIENSTVENRELQTIIEIADMSLATSGNYRKFYIKNGKKYAHTINPKTGHPAKNKLLSATVLTMDCIYADAYATAFMVMGLEESKHFISAHKNIEAYFIYTDKNNNLKTEMSKGFKTLIIE